MFTKGQIGPQHIGKATCRAAAPSVKYQSMKLANAATYPPSGPSVPTLPMAAQALELPLVQGTIRPSAAHTITRSFMKLGHDASYKHGKALVAAYDAVCVTV